MFRVMRSVLAAICMLVLLAVGISLVTHSIALAQTNNLIWSQVWDGQSIIGPSMETRAASTAINIEFADDFDIGGTIQRVVVSGSRDMTAPSNPVVYGANVRFYQWLNGQPGALQAESFIASGDPALVYDPVRPAQFDITLPTPFQATGKHFVSVQVVMDAGTLDGWYWQSANSGAPRGASVFQRNKLAGSTWSIANNSDGAFQLYGTATAAPRVDSLSATTLDRSGRLRIFGANFGGTQGASQVLIDGLPAIVTQWSEVAITAYVPEAARLTTVPVQVVNASGQPSNTANLTVTARAANGRVKWRFQADSMYILQRPAIGADGTVVIHDSSGIVYALKPDGGLKWIFKTRVFAGGPPSIGADGTVYVADSSTITAINPDGSLKWSFTEPPGGQGVIAGPTVGPDGNIYAVTDQGGLGALSLSPAGQLLWSNRGNPVVAEQGQLGVEMSFGPSHSGGAVDQFYVTFDDFGSSERDHMYAFRLTGEQVWTIPLFMSMDSSGMMQQQRPVVGTNGTVFLSAVVPTGGYWSLNAFDPASGALLRSYFPSPGMGISVPTIGPDGTVYFAQSLSYLEAVSADFVPKWRFSDGSILSYPIVSPANDIVLTGGVPTYGMPGFVKAFNRSNGQLLWSLNLGVENGGNQDMESIPRFTPDGSTVYFGTAILGGSTADTFCYLYALDATGSGATTGSVLRSTGITLSAKLVKNGTVTVTGVVTVKDENGAAVPSATVAATWSLPNGTKQNQTATTDKSGNATFSTKSGRGTYTLTVTNITKTGYTFDPANSVLSKSITK